MPSVFLSHSSIDKPFVRELASFLQQDDQIKVWLDEAEIAPGENIVTKIADGLESDFVLYIMSPDSVASNWVKEEWTDAFWEQTNKGEVKLAGVLYKDCAIPRLIRNKKYFDLRSNQPEGFRQIRTWLLTGRPVTPPRVNLLPTRPPLFVGREADLEDLHKRLQPGVVLGLSGMPGRGKTTLTLEFAHHYQTDFEAVYWLPCQSGDLVSIAGDLTRQLGLSLTGDINQIVAELKVVCGRRRCLLILDNVETEAPSDLIPGGQAVVLVTTRQPGLRFLRLHPALRLELFTEEQCFALFRIVLGEEEVGGHVQECRKLFDRVGCLPLAVSLSASLIKDDVVYTISSIAADLPADVTDLIGQAIAALPSESSRLLSAMAACAPEGFRLGLAAGLIGMDETAALKELSLITRRSLAEEVSREQRRYRMHALVRAAADGGEFARQHAEALNKQFENWESDWQACEQDLPDFQVALAWAILNEASFTEELAFYGYALTRRIGHPAQAFEICERQGRAAERRNDKDAMERWFGNQGLILEAWGRLEEALALLKKQEALCMELGNKDGLRATYGNQALILRAWGRLEEALALLKKQEALCMELGNKDGLQISYGNQALILRAWGRLEEAMALHKKQEALCLELGNKDGLQASYGNQGLILEAWGRLEEALALHKKSEALCVELGNKDGLQWTYGNQALILKDWGRLVEALALLKKKEALCMELGNKDGLGYCYWNWGLLARSQKNPSAEREKLNAALAIFTDLNMPRQRDAVAAELNKTRSAGAS
jgi:tetratricopeptide (TPR) repeat protein